MATASWSELGQTSAPAREQMDWMSSLNAPEDLAGSDQRVTPAYATTFPQWHPPTLIVAAEYDPLRDEAVAEMNTEPGWRSTRFRHRTPGVVDRLFMARPGRGR